MADLLAKESKKGSKPFFNLSVGQEVEGKIVEILNQEIILDLGTKSEGILPKKDLTQDRIKSLNIGEKLPVFVLQLENESGLAEVSLQKSSTEGGKWDKFISAQKNNQVLSGKGIEVNKGGLIIEIGGVRGFLPSSQVSLSQADNIEGLVGKDVQVLVIEVDQFQKRLIFSQKTTISEDIKKHLQDIKVGDEVSGKVAALMPFGIFVSLPNDIEGLVHVSEISWEKTEDPSGLFKAGDEVSAKVVSVDQNTSRVNLSIKQLGEDPFAKKAEKFKPDDIVKGVVSKVSSSNITVDLGGSEGVISTKHEGLEDYQVGKTVTCLVDNIDKAKRRITLAPFITSTKDLIYK